MANEAGAGGMGARIMSINDIDKLENMCADVESSAKGAVSKIDDIILEFNTNDYARQFMESGNFGQEEEANLEKMRQAYVDSLELLNNLSQRTRAFLDEQRKLNQQSSMY